MKIKVNLNMMFMMLMVLSTLMICMNNMWLSMWIYLEINLISFIYIMVNFKNIKTLESSLIYFLIQTIASILLLISMIMINILNQLNILISLSLLLKLGLAPFHFWMIVVIDLMNWMTIYILLTWQKIAPMMIFYYYNNMKMLIYFLIMSLIIGSLMGLNYSSLKKLLTYSSINQLSWLMMSLNLINKMWKMYFMMYMYMLFVIIYQANMFKFNNINDLLLNKNNLFNMFIYTNMFSLGGLPPFLGFFPKLMVIMLINNTMLMFNLIMFSLITLFYYLRFMISSMMINYLKLNKILFLFKNKINLLMINMMMMNLSLLIMFMIY